MSYKKTKIFANAVFSELNHLSDQEINQLIPYNDGVNICHGKKANIFTKIEGY